MFKGLKKFFLFAPALICLGIILVYSGLPMFEWARTEESYGWFVMVWVPVGIFCALLQIVILLGWFLSRKK